MERKTRLRHLATLKETGHGSWMDVEQSGGIRCGLLSRINQMGLEPLIACVTVAVPAPSLCLCLLNNMLPVWII